MAGEETQMHKASRFESGRDEQGATATEYALLVGLIAMAIFAAVGTFGVAVADLFTLRPGTFP
jgi:Flp pilus assembly pilin Flp